jgi:hypothetical protein
MTRRVKIAIAAPLAVVAALAVLAVLGLLAGRGAGSSSGAAAGASPGGAAHTPALSRPLAAAADGAAGEAAMGGGETQYAAAVPPASVPSAHFLVRTGDLSLLVARGTLLATVDRIQALTAAMDGYVMSSSLGTQPDGTPQPVPLGAPVSSSGEQGSASGEQGSGVAAEPGAVAAPSDASNPYANLVLRVPEQSFDAAIRRFSKLGDVRSASTSSDDVTSQYVDLRARLRHYRAVERRLVGFLGQTKTVNQMLAVQDRIDQVQLQIEELSAQIKALSETTTYGTLSVFVSERDRPATALHSTNTFGGTLGNSIQLLARGLRFSGLVLTALLPFLAVSGAVAAAVWYVVRRVRRSRSRALPQAPGA